MTDICSDNKTISVLKAASLIALVTVFSKLVGFLRDVVIANYYGASMVSDAYFYAYQIPALAIILLGGVGGPFHSATVAVFSKLIKNFSDKPDKVLNNLFNTFLTTSFIFFLVLSVLIFVFSNQIMGIIISGDNQELINLAASHLRIMSPILLIGGLVGIYYGVLVSYRHFMLPNLSPIVMSLVIIIMIAFAHDDKTGTVLALATSIGALCQLLIQMPKVRQIGFKILPNLDVKNNQNFKTICELLFPAVLSSTVGQIHIYVDMFFASGLKEGAWTAIGYANRVFQFPVGILVTAFLVPLFPVFAKLVADEDFEGIKTYFNKGVGVLLFAAIPIIIGILILGKDGVSLVFQRGAFDDNATFMVTQALWFLSFSIIPYVFRDSITRIYYSFNDSLTPYLVAFSSIVLKVILNFLLVDKMGIGGITLSTSLVTLFNAVLLGIFIKRKIRLDYNNLFKNFFKMCAAGLITFAVCFFTASIFDNLTISPLYVSILKICAVGILCIVLYSGLSILFKMDYAVVLFDRIKGKINGIKQGKN